MKTKIYVLKTLIDNYPVVQNHVIAEANHYTPYPASKGCANCARMGSRSSLTRETTPIPSIRRRVIYTLCFSISGTNRL
jgi:hypothetical protein